MVVSLLYASHEAHLKSEQADVAQLVEQPIRNRQVNGSSPFVGSTLTPSKDSVNGLGQGAHCPIYCLIAV